MKLHQVLNAPISDFERLGQTTQTPDGKYIFIDRGASVLAVAHLDSVQEGYFTPYYTKNHKTGHRFLHHPRLDDRIGAHIILNLLPKLGVNVDVLLTEGEESGLSTAQYFELPEGKTYNWMVEFDRGGTDVVTYQYRDSEWHLALRDVGYKVGYGSFSDISYLDHLGILGVNIGVSYYDYHSLKAYCNLNTLRENVNLFVDFYNLYKDNPTVYVPTTYSNVRYGSSRYYSWNDDNSDYYSGRVFDYKDYARDYEETEPVTDLDLVYARIIASTLVNKGLPLPQQFQQDETEEEDDTELYEDYWRRKGYGNSRLLSPPIGFWKEDQDTKELDPYEDD